MTEPVKFLGNSFQMLHSLPLVFLPGMSILPPSIAKTFSWAYFHTPRMQVLMGPYVHHWPAVEVEVDVPYIYYGSAR